MTKGHPAAPRPHNWLPGAARFLHAADSRRELPAWRPGVAPAWRRTSSNDLAFSRPIEVPSPPLSFSTAVCFSRVCAVGVQGSNLLLCFCLFVTSMQRAGLARTGGCRLLPDRSGGGVAPQTVITACVAAGSGGATLMSVPSASFFRSSSLGSSCTGSMSASGTCSMQSAVVGASCWGSHPRCRQPGAQSLVAAQPAAPVCNAFWPVHMQRCNIGRYRRAAASFAARISATRVRRGAHQASHAAHELLVVHFERALCRLAETCPVHLGLEQLPGLQAGCSSSRDFGERPNTGRKPAPSTARGRLQQRPRNRGDQATDKLDLALTMTSAGAAGAAATPLAMFAG